MKLSGKGLFFAISAGIFFGVIPILILGVTRNGSASSAFCIMIRMAGGSVLLLPSTFTRFCSRPISKKIVRDIFIGSAFMSCTSILLYAAYEYIPSGIGITLHYTYPLVIMLVNVLLFHVHFSPATKAAMVISLLGVILLCDNSILSPGSWIGILLALCSCLTFTIYLLWLERRHLGNVDPLIFAQLLTAFNTVFLLGYVLVTDQLYVKLSLGVLIPLACTGVIAVLAVTTQALAIKYTGSVYTSILGTLEPIICTLGSALVLHDKVSFRTLSGSALILFSVIVVTLDHGKRKHLHPIKTHPSGAVPEEEPVSH